MRVIGRARGGWRGRRRGRGRVKSRQGWFGLFYLGSKALSGGETGSQICKWLALYDSFLVAERYLIESKYLIESIL